MEAQDLNILLERPLKICYTSFEVAVIHIGINNIVTNKKYLNTDHMLQN